jgi:hypothetical protein
LDFVTATFNVWAVPHKIIFIVVTTNEGGLSSTRDFGIRDLEKAVVETPHED